MYCGQPGNETGETQTEKAAGRTTMSTVTNKEFREVLNKRFNRKTLNTAASKTYRGNNYRDTRRAYGDYLWFNDLGQFNSDKAEYEAGRL